MKKKIEKANNLVDKFFKWVVVSSANHQQASLTIKGILLQHVGLGILVLGALNVNISNDQLISDIGRISSMIGTGLAIVGMLRKLYFEGKAWVGK